jgi:hypothetical protein
MYQKKQLRWRAQLFPTGGALGMLFARNEAVKHLAERNSAVLADGGTNLEVTRIFTATHEPTFEEGYTEFLGRMGYAPDPKFERWWGEQL